MKSYEQIERQEKTKADAFVAEQMNSFSESDLAQMNIKALKLFFEIAYWRNRSVSLIFEKNETVLPAIKAKREELESQRAKAEDSHNRSSDYHTPPSTYVAALEGQVSAFDWIIARLENA